MADNLKDWLRDNHTLIGFLILQAIAIVAYAVRLEGRVTTLETRGAPFTVQLLDKMNERITVLEQKIDKNQDSIERIVEVMTKNLSVNPVPGGQR